MSETAKRIRPSCVAGSFYEASPERLREEILSRLDAKTAAFYRTLPEGKAFLPDEAVSGEYRIGEIMCALTVLEVNGLVRALPGGRFLLS